MSEHQDRSIIAVLFEGVIVVGPGGALMQANPAARAILGHALDPSVDDRDWWRCLDARHPDGTELVFDSPGEEVTRSHRDLRDVSIRVRRGDGALRSLRLNYRLLRDSGDRPDGLVISFHDVTEREAEHERAVTAEARLRDAHALAALSSWEWDVRRDRVVVLQGLPDQPDEHTADGTGIDALLEAIQPEDRETIRLRIEDLRAGASDHEMLRYRYRLYDGQTRWVETRMRAVRDADGELTAVCGITQDVTERRRAEQTAWVRAQMLDEIDAAVIATDAAGRVSVWSAGAESLYGWTAEETVGRPVSDLAIDPSERLVPRDIGQTAKEGGHWEGPFLARHKDGTSFPAHVRGGPLHDAEGGATGLLGVSVDATAQLRGERELRSARDYLHAVTDSMAQGMVTLDLEGRTIYMNDAAEDMLGWSARELMGKVFHSEVHFRRPDGGPYPLEDCPILGVRHDGEHVHCNEDVFVRSHGADLAVEYTASPFETPEGVRGTVLLFADITERQAREAAVQHDLDDLAWVGRTTTGSSRTGSCCTPSRSSTSPLERPCSTSC